MHLDRTERCLPREITIVHRVIGEYSLARLPESNELKERGRDNL
jgi:hypothetical protein